MDASKHVYGLVKSKAELGLYHTMQWSNQNFLNLTKPGKFLLTQNSKQPRVGVSIKINGISAQPIKYLVNKVRFINSQSHRLTYSL